MPTHYNGSEEARRALDLYIKLLRANNAVVTQMFYTLNASGLTPTQYGVLEALLHLGPLRPSQIAQKQLKSPNNITATLDGLEKQGLVARVPTSSDRRSVTVNLTDEGRKLIEAVFPPHVERMVRIANVLSPEEQETLSALLRKLGLGAANLENS